MKQHLRRHWFLGGLILVLVLGFCWPQFFTSFASARLLRDAIVASVLFLMALPLETSALRRTLRRPWAALLASSINMGLLPFAAWAMSSLLSGDLATGLLVIAAAPCTLASAALWTRRAGGDETVALMVTVLTNLACFRLTPLWIVTTTGDRVTIDGREMVAKLAMLVVLPMALGQALHQHRLVGQWATSRRRTLGAFAQLGILSMVLIGATQSALRLSELEWGKAIGLFDFAWMATVVLALHVGMLAVGWWLAAMVGIARPGRIAVSIAGSQKTLMVGLHVATSYFGGLTVLPAVVYHVGQLAFDTLVADYWAGKPERQSFAAEASKNTG
jgi:sodium/bile acid cotransporter 7